MNKEDIEKINKIFLIKNTKIVDEDPCFCGSGLLFLDCCKKEAKFWISDKFLNKVIGYAKANAFNVSSIPTSFLNEYNKEFQKKFDICANPDCHNKCIGSHIFGKSLVKKNFTDTKCKGFEIDDNGKKQLVQIGTNNDMKYPIFCSSCDNKVFKEIDEIDHDLLDKDNQFLHFLRSMSFQYQFLRSQLAFSHQLVFAYPAIASARSLYRNDQRKEEKIDLTWFIENFIRYKYQRKLLRSLWDIYNGNTEKKFSLHVRAITTDNMLFANGIINPQFDLQNKKVIFEKEASILYIALPLSKEKLFIMTFTQDKEYIQYLDQLYGSNDYKFKKIINSYLAPLNTSYSIFLHSNYEINSQALINGSKRKFI